MAKSDSGTNTLLSVIVLLLITVVVFLFSIFRNGTANQTQNQNQYQYQYQYRYPHGNIFELTREPTRYFTRTLGDYLKQDSYSIVGVVHSVDPEDDSVYNLYSRRYFRDDSRYQYKVIERGVTLNINGAEPMEQLRTGDIISIPGKESIGDFTVVIDDKYYI